MTTHRLKIFVKYADAIMSGAKTFEIRKNDRDYEVGDSIVFNVVADDCHSFEEAVRHPLNGATYPCRAQAGSVHPGQADGRRLLPLLRLRMGWTDLGTYRLWGHAGV